MSIVEKVREWVGQEFDTSEFKISERSILSYAKACGEQDPRFSDPSHPDFQAPPTLTSKYVSRRIFPEAFPRIGVRGFDAGKSVEVLGTIRAGDILTARSSIADVYEKTGRSGAMIFVVHRMEFSNQHGDPVAIVDWRLVRQPDPE